MHAFVIAGGSPEERQTEIHKKLEEWSVSTFDGVILTTEEPSIGISEIRAFQQRLQLSPGHSPYTAGIIQNAQLLTIEAQNALLKTLEEPPPHARLILETSLPQSLLATILSRCQILHLGETKGGSDEKTDTVFSDIQRLQKTEKIGERVKIIDGLVQTREEAKVWIEQALMVSRVLLLTSPNQETAQLTRRLLFAQKQLAANVTPKLVLDAVFLHPDG